MKDRAREVLKKHVDHLLDDYNDITAMDIGCRTKNGVVIEGEVYLIMWVKRKLPKSVLGPDRLLPEATEGVPVDVLEGEMVFT